MRARHDSLIRLHCFSAASGPGGEGGGGVGRYSRSLECVAAIGGGGRVASLIVQELCESRGGRPGLSVLTSLLVYVDVKIY